MTSLNYPMVTV